MKLRNDFFQQQNALINRFKNFENKHKLNFFKNLLNEKNEDNFLSTVSEINFGIFFDNLCDSIYYEKSFNGLTPDWTLEINGQTIIAEVMRLNPSKNDKTNLDFDNNINIAIREIKIGCFLSFDYDETLLDRENIDIHEQRNLVHDWLRKGPQEGDMLLLPSGIEVELLKFSKSVDHACFCGGGGAINFNYKRLNGENSALLTKAKKYDKIINEQSLPYIICIYIDQHAWFREDDLYQSLYGLSTEYLGEFSCSSHLIENALYYSALEVMNNVSGVLLRRNDEHIYYHNFSYKNKLTDENKNLLMQWQHPYE